MQHSASFNKAANFFARLLTKYEWSPASIVGSDMHENKRAINAAFADDPDTLISLRNKHRAIPWHIISEGAALVGLYAAFNVESRHTSAALMVGGGVVGMLAYIYGVCRSKNNAVWAIQEKLISSSGPQTSGPE